jgi:hypothetical protein
MINKSQREVCYWDTYQGEWNPLSSEEVRTKVEVGLMKVGRWES